VIDDVVHAGEKQLVGQRFYVRQRFREVLVLYRKRSGEMRLERWHRVRAGAFLIQRLEGSRLARRRYAF
jgi:hypothetical protein